MNLALSSAERGAILQALDDAPDSILVHAFEMLNKTREAFELAHAKLGAPVSETVAVVVAASKPAERPNVSPGEPTITKIGEAATLCVIGALDHGKQPDARYAEHAKLLWKRDKIKFDGLSYYL